MAVASERPLTTTVAPSRASVCAHDEAALAAELRAAAQAGCDPILAIGASAGFATPFGYQTNLMVYGPGGYRFSDYWKLGSVMMALYFVVAVFWVPLVWRF